MIAPRVQSLAASRTTVSACGASYILVVKLTREESESIYDAGKERVVEVLFGHGLVKYCGPLHVLFRCCSELLVDSNTAMVCWNPQALADRSGRWRMDEERQQPRDKT